MNNSFYSYLDSFDSITLIIPKDIYNFDSTYSLIGNNEIIDLQIKDRFDLGNEEKIITTFDAYLKLEIPYDVVDSRGNKSFLRMGKIHRSTLFDSIYYYKKNDLGANYTKDSTKFKIWAPTAKKVTLELISKDNVKEKIALKYRNQGIWRAIIDRDLEGYKYRYHINVNGKTRTTIDPYAISADANAKYAYIVDRKKFYEMKYHVDESHENILIYEASIRDFTSFYKHNPKSSTYELFTDLNLKTKDGNDAGIKHLKKLGVTHIQLMPFFLFGGIDENNPKKKYNWGYNPVSYNVPSGAYSLDPSNPYQRINDLKRMIDHLHKYGFKVVMDVVYNHVYDYDNFPFEIMCPGYMYSYKDGILTEYSGCKNDVNSSKNMVRKFIIDSVKYWANEYKVDGFRFDLMGLIDFETMNDIAQDFKYYREDFLIYGEGWKMIQSNKADNLAHMYNKALISDIGFFNDRFRETIKQYIMNRYVNISDTIDVIKGSCRKGFLFKYPHQSINYLECHDNMTLFDYIKSNLNEDDEIVKQRCFLGISVILLSLGEPLLHSGMEFFSTKKMIDNSYKSPDSINKINWDLIDKNLKYIDDLKKIIDIRFNHKVFNLDNSTEIQNKISIKSNDKNTIFYHLSMDSYSLYIVFKNNSDKESFSLDNYDVLFSNIRYDKKEIEGIGTLILKRR